MKNIHTFSDRIAAQKKELRQLSDAIWNHPLVFVLLALSLVLVWILRKRKGLA